MTSLGKYEVLGELAKGSMGVIYRGRDPILDREVALKTIAGTGGIDPELKERFYREARAGARLHHPNVITVYELGEQEGLVFIALELLTGCDLRQFISERRPMPARQKIEIMAAVCDGLHHAHGNGIVHRDIKPSNVFLTDSGVPKILDFGVARLSASKLTVVGRVLGTPFYMAPEQIMGHPCDARSDQFSLALVTYELLAYAHPFAGDSIPKRIVGDNPDPLAGRDPDFPAGLEPVLRRALARDPAARYPSVEEFGKALRSLLHAAAPTPAPVREQAPSTRNMPSLASLPAVPPVAPVPDLPSAEPRPKPAISKYANTEVKMSVILLALQGFDEAIEKRDLRTAREALTTIEELSKVDDRFATAAKESRNRLQELEASLPRVPELQPAPPAAPRVTAPPVTPPPAAEPPPRPPTSYRTEAPAERPAPEPPVAPAPPPRVAPPSEPGSATLSATRLMETLPTPARPRPEPAAAAAPPRGVTPPPVSPLPVTPPPVETGNPTDDATSMFRIPGTAAGGGYRPPARTPAPVPPAPAPPPAAPAPERRISGVRPGEAPAARPGITLPPRPAAPLPQPTPSANRTPILVGGAVAAALLLLLGAWFALKPKNATAVPAEATARVTAQESAIFTGPDDGAGVVVRLKKGDSVNVIHPPRTATQEWTQVQYLAGSHVYPPGVVKTADLGNWSSAQPDVALYLVQMNAPPDGADAGQLRQYAQGLETFIQRFSGTPQQAAAQAELDKTNAALGRTGNGTPAASQVQKPAAPHGVPPADQAAAAPSAFNLDAELARADKQWEDGHYAQAERILKRILQQRPDSAIARELLQKVQKAKQLEGTP